MLIENAPPVQQNWSSQQLKKPQGLTGKMYRRAMFESIAKLNPTIDGSQSRHVRR